MDAVLISVLICALFILAGLIERAAFAIMEWLLAEPLPDFMFNQERPSSDELEEIAHAAALSRGSLTA